MPNVSGVRRLGSAALALAYVAAGRYEGFWEAGLKPWDLAAGIIIVREAGGYVSDLSGGDAMLKVDEAAEREQIESLRAFRAAQAANIVLYSTSHDEIHSVPSSLAAVGWVALHTILFIFFRLAEKQISLRFWSKRTPRTTCWWL